MTVAKLIEAVRRYAGFHTYEMRQGCRRAKDDEVEHGRADHSFHEMTACLRFHSRICFLPLRPTHLKPTGRNLAATPAWRQE